MDINNDETVILAMKEVERRNEIRKFVESGMNILSVTELLKYQGEVILLLYSALSKYQDSEEKPDFLTPILELHNRLQSEGLEIEKFESVTLKDEYEESLGIEESIDKVIDILKNTYVNEGKYKKEPVSDLGDLFLYITKLEEITEEARLKLPAIVLATQLSLILQDCFR